MRTFLIGLLVVGGLLIGLTKAAFPSYESVAETRVKNVLNGMKEGTGTGAKVETAMAMWADNKLRITDRDRLNWATDNFDNWRMKKDLYRKTGEYEIESVEMVKGSEDTAIVEFKLEGKKYKVLVPKDAAISWAD